MMSRSLNRFVLLAVPLWIPISQASVSCTQNEECKSALKENSLCVDGFCTNPFHYGGCLKSFLPDWHKIRVCNSDDPPEAAEMGFCRVSDLDYMEVRILSLNWESAFFETWILQIILSEILDVPVSVETGFPDLSVDFYDVNSPMDYGNFDVLYSELQLSSEVLDCRLVKTSNLDEYQPCAHVVPEFWSADTYGDNFGTKSVGPLEELGAIANQGWFVPGFTAERDPSLTSYFGLKGNKNRQKLAETFKRPTTWKEYCDEVSEDGCATDDGVASRAPLESEEKKMFVEGLYTGHFRATEQNDCVKHPSNCTGHIADFPCGWGGVTPQQLYHLDIALESNGASGVGKGYEYSELVEIWKAANATKSDVMMMWWYPEALYQAFIGTDAEFVPVVLPPATQECLEARISWSSLCRADFDVTTSNSLGVCDHNARSLKKIMGDGLYQAIYDPDIPEALRSPAYVTIENFEITSLELGQIFKYWYDRRIDPWNFDPRHATCSWVIENLDTLQSIIPNSHPRIIEQEDSGNPLVVGALILSCMAGILVLISIFSVHMKRNTKVMFYSQTEFLFCVLLGLLLMSVGSFILSIPPSDASCIATVWLSDIGYIVHIVPLVVRIFAINKLASSGKQMQRVRLGKRRLFFCVFIAAAVICGYLVVWTILSTPERMILYELSEKTTSDGETVVIASDYCGMESQIWRGLAWAWKLALLLPGVVIGFVASRVREDMNDTKSMSVLFYLHAIFLALQIMTTSLLAESNPSDLMGYQSILMSLDVIFAMLIYILPKIRASNEQIDDKEILPDLFLNSSILIADIQGFAAWSSVREPVQVFKLLEALYETFDRMADKHNVYKVETVRDSYVAASGIPEQQQDHAVLISKFAADILKKMDHMTKKLEMMFGPDTGDLMLRIGIHSGPVTGGFLKGKGARFQLFGDSMTTACLIASTGQDNRVHLSKTTADLLIKAGHGKWIEKRDDRIHTVEKGELETYWLTRGIRNLGDFDNHPEASSCGQTFSLGSKNADGDEIMDSEERWIEWNVDVLKAVLIQIVAQRSNRVCDSLLGDLSSDRLSNRSHSSMPLDEVVEIVELPEFDKKTAKRQRSTSANKELDADVMAQLKQYVTMVAGMYNDNPFHNFAHASYVVMAVSKYMNRIVAASEVDIGFDSERCLSSTQAALHDHTYGITSDPLTRFACVFSALIHDVDHPGVPNPQLIKEDGRLSGIYKGRSVAEQNSFDLAWDLLMDSTFAKLRATICANDAELRRFRQLVINSVMATDLGDKELKALRNGRWEKAFAKSESAVEGNPRDATNRKATIVIEHLIQAADIAHTCQHWNIYRKWNERLFQECYKAYREGRAETNPADGWYKGELGFYDFYIIPLAKKLRDCGVFGPTSDENLDYAMNNRAMWEKEGEKIVAEMLEKVVQQYSLVEEETTEMNSIDFSYHEQLVKLKD